MKLLITGAAGFLGSHLSAKLLEDGHQVVGIDDFSTGSRSNLINLANNPKFELIEHDVRIPISIKIDAILNFACPASPVHYQLDPVRTIETNFLGIINMLHLAKDNNAILIQASTSEIYGDPLVSPQNESYWGNVNPIGPRSCYDEGKRAAETLCFDYKRQYNADTRVIRIFNTYGPNMQPNDGRVISNFIVQALNNSVITIYGDGSQTRSFCFVDDLVTGIIDILNLNVPINLPINLGNPNDFTILQLAKLIIKMTKSKSKLVHLPLPQDDPKQRKPDIALAKSLISWKPEIELEVGLAKTIEYFQKVIQT